MLEIRWILRGTALVPAVLVTTGAGWVPWGGDAFPLLPAEWPIVSPGPREEAEPLAYSFPWP